MPTVVLRVLSDIRLTWRVARRRPVPVFIAALTVALVTAGAGAMSAVLSAAFVRPLPFPDDSRLLRLYTQPPGTTDFSSANPFHPLEFVRFRDRPAPFEAVEGIWAIERSIGGDGEPESVPVGAVSGGFFTLTGPPPLLGRAISPDDDRDAARVTVLGYGFWMRRFGGDPGVVGRTLLIDREPFQVVGVMPASFEPVFTNTQLWTPMGFREGRFVLPNATFIQTVARLPRGMTVARAFAEADERFAAIRDESPATLTGWSLGVRFLRDAQFSQQQPAILMLVAAVVVLVLIAAANLAHLAVADVLSRRSEIALRAALGASRTDLLRSYMVDRLVVAGAGGALGLAVAWIALPALLALDPRGLGSFVPVQLDWATGGAAWSLVTSVLLAASLAPAWQASRRDLSATMLDGGRRTGPGRGQARLGTMLVGVEMGMAVLLVACGALVLDALGRTAATDPGLDAAGVAGGQLRLAESAYPTSEARAAFADLVLERVRALPGVTAASTTTNRFVPGFAYVTLVHIDGKPTPTGEPHTVQFRRVSPDYFRTAGIPELQGRTFDARDRIGGQPVAVVSESFARTHWPDEDPIGRTVRRGSGGSMTVIGVVGDVSDVGFGQAPQPTLYTPYGQGSTIAAPLTLVVRSTREPGDLFPALRAAIREIDPLQPLADLTTVDAFLEASLGGQRFRATILGLFALVGVVLACAGIYGVTARSVAERTREVGVRVALGASVTRVWWAMSRRALSGLGAGALAGMAAALVADRALSSFLPELAGGSILAVASAPVGALAAIGVTAALWPARRAARLDPIAALSAD